jgi:hypothetical protein
MKQSEQNYFIHANTKKRLWIFDIRTFSFYNHSLFYTIVGYLPSFKTPDLHILTFFVLLDITDIFQLNNVCILQKIKQFFLV